MITLTLSGSCFALLTRMCLRTFVRYIHYKKKGKKKTGTLFRQPHEEVTTKGACSSRLTH